MIEFFAKEDEQRIIEAIQDAECNTSGEIRVHLEQKPRKDAMSEARRVFAKLKMHQTKARNGVLILLAPERREFAILGDQGINDVVEGDFWEQERDLMQQHFRAGDFTGGLVAVIGQIGEKLQAHFPYQDDDENELSDEISYG